MLAEIFKFENVINLGKLLHNIPLTYTITLADICKFVNVKILENFSKTFH